MREYKRIIEEPFYSICNEEWKRAKSIIHFNCKKPNFFWNRTKRNNWVAYYSHLAHNIVFHISWMQLEWNKETEKEFRETLRHEFAHIHTKGHGNDFLVNMERLGGTRYCQIPLPRYKKEKKVKEKKKIDLVSVRYGRALESLKRYEARLKRDENLVKKWEKKVKYYEKKLEVNN